MTSKSRGYKVFILILREIGLKFSIRPLYCFSRVTPLPASTSTVSCFLAYLLRKTASYQYVMNHHKFARLLHLHQSFACDVLNSFSVALTKKGLKHVMGIKSRQKQPITVDLLRRTKTVLDLSISTQAALCCLLLVAFFSFLRKSNLTAPSARAFDASKHLTRNGIMFSSNGAVL